MLKLLKISGQIIAISFEWFLILFIVFSFAIRTSSFQTFLAEKIASNLSNKLNATVAIKNVYIVLPGELAIEDFILTDTNKDTLFFLEKTYISLNNYNIPKISVDINSISLEGGYIHIKRDKNAKFNYAFLKNYFFNKKRKKKNPIIKIDKLNLKNITFKYDDYRKKKRNYGVDYFHLKTEGINGKVENFKYHNGLYYGDIKTLNLKEKSGFTLEDFKANASISNKGIYLKKLMITSEKSEVESDKFNMISNGLDDFKYFVDSVEFDARLNKSSIDLSETSLFAHFLKGMNDTIELSTSIEKKFKCLKLKNFDLKILNKTQVKGTINLPDYRNIKSSFFNERIDYAYIDIVELESIKLPNSLNLSHIKLDPTIKRLKYIKTRDIQLDGFYSQFVIAGKDIKTKLGSIKIDNGILFKKNLAKNIYTFQQSNSNKYDIKIEKFNLGELIKNKNIGLIDGLFFLSGEIKNINEISFNSIIGEVNRFDYLNYPYNKIKIIEGNLIDKKFEGKIDIKDDNVDLTYNGSIDFKDELHLKFDIEVNNALLNQLNISKKKSKFSSNITFDIQGDNPNKYRGSVVLYDFILSEENKKINVPSITINIQRDKENDYLSVLSDIVELNVKGKVNMNEIVNNFNNQFYRIFPALFNYKNKYDFNKNNHFEFDLTINDSKNLLSIIYPSLYVAPKTTFSGHYYEDSSFFLATLKSDSIFFDNLKSYGIDCYQSVNKNDLSVSIKSNQSIYNDSLKFNQLLFSSIGKLNGLESNISWKSKNKISSLVKWSTSFIDETHYKMFLDTSYFHINSNKWHIENQSEFTFNNDTIHVEKFLLTRNNQIISADGYLSKKDKHKLKFNIQKLDLSELSNLISKVPLKGIFNSRGYISNPINNFDYEGKATIEKFTIQNQLLGDINLSSFWKPISKSISLDGNLTYKEEKTFDFIGDYYPYMKKNKLDFNLIFDNTDIQFTNALLNPDVLSEIKGYLKGKLKISGDIEKPNFDGYISLITGSAKLELLGTHFEIEGPIKVDNSSFYINEIPLFDEEGNAGKLTGSVYHDNFKNFNFDVSIDLEEDAINKDPLIPWKSMPLNKFLILNSKYKSGDIYYGKGYATGMIDIFGYSNNLDITVNLETKEGTKINIPMYGIKEIEDENFIHFVNKKNTINTLEPKIDFTGVNLDLNFKITPSAEVKIIFNEKLEDEITANGQGDLNITLNKIGDVNMNGIYTVKNGVYDFAMGLIKQKFYIENGGSISWTGDPYNAILDLNTFYRVNANISTVQQTNINTNEINEKEILCYLNLKESLVKPAINFKIESPTSSDFEKSILNQINSDQAELNRQFFSLLLWRRFQPIAGNISADGSGALDLISNQINSMLSKVSSDYRLNVNLDSDKLTGEDTYEFGVTKGFLDNRLILSGSFGIENQKIDESKDRSSIIGDVRLEYLLNENGTFRINIFNESNNNRIIQNQDQGPFTQGAGLHYQEDFNNIKDFKAIQYFFDIFRKKQNKRYPIKRKRRQVSIK
ncbi:MAG: hypothetical protein CL844_03455 [Crocinitomicaceae bacterium]|nr:hypothetical protein [Crocinitomicaceae bacterium]